MACTAGDQLENAKCFVCLSPVQLRAIDVYLLATIAGVSTDPGTLLNDAKCFLCLTEQQLAAIQAYLLCQINGG